MDNIRMELDGAAAMKNVAGPFARAIIAVTPQGVYAVAVEDQVVGKNLRFTGQYAAAELQMLRGVCTSQTRLLVIGANIGALAIPLARHVQKMVAIEANPETCELLRLNVQLNGVANCEVIHKAASDKVESLTFLLNRTNPAGSKREPVIKDRLYYYDGPRTAQVEAAPLDDLFPSQEFDVVIMDIEGSEYFALCGMQRLLASARVLQVEFLPHHLTNVAGVTVEQFLSVISPHFECMVVPTRRAVVAKPEFASVLSAMSERGENDEGILFMKTPASEVRFS